MTMYINYNRLFTLTLCHHYFADGYDDGLRIYPSAETQILLKSGRMLFKRLPHGVTVLYSAAGDEVTPLVAIDKNVKFVFFISSADVIRMLSVTDFDEPGGGRHYEAGNLLYFRNDPSTVSTNPNNPEVLVHELIDSRRAALFTYVFSIPANPPVVYLRVSDENDNPVSVGKELDGSEYPVVLAVPIGSDNQFSHQIDLRYKPKGRYTITILDSTKTVVLNNEKIYVDETLAAQDSIGIVEIVYPAAAGHMYGKTESYQIEFRRTVQYWKYVIVNRSGNIDLSTDSLLISDQGSANAFPYVVNDFSRAYAAIGLKADNPGKPGNSVVLGSSGSNGNQAVMLSGSSLSGGADGVCATGSITIVNNEKTGYRVTIGSRSFTEGVDFNRGNTPFDTAEALLSAIQADSSHPVSATLLDYDVLVNNLPSLVFRSEQSIPVYEKPKLNIQLKHTSDNQVIVANLPNPSQCGIRKAVGDESESEVYVYI
jgi:hypothetical protein